MHTPSVSFSGGSGGNSTALFVVCWGSLALEVDAGCKVENYGSASVLPSPLSTSVSFKFSLLLLIAPFAVPQ